MSNDGRHTAPSNQAFSGGDPRAQPLWWLKPTARDRVTKLFSIVIDFCAHRSDILDALAKAPSLTEAHKLLASLTGSISSTWRERFPNEARIKFNELESCLCQYLPAKDAVARYMTLVLDESSYLTHGGLYTLVAYHRARQDILESLFMQMQESNSAKEVFALRGRCTELQTQISQMTASKDHATRELDKVRALSAELKIQLENITQRQAKTAYQEGEALKRASHWENQFNLIFNENRNLRNQIAATSDRARKAEESLYRHVNIAAEMKKQLLMSPHAHSPTTPQTTQSEGQTRHSAFQFHPHQPLSHLPRSQDHNTHLNAAFVQNNQQPPTVTIVPAPAHSSAPKSVQASSLTAPSPQPARIVGQGNTPSTTPSVQSVPLTSPVVAEGVAQEGVATVMSRTPSATSPIGREVKPNELSSSELASKPVFLRLFNHMFEQVSGLPKIEYECTFCRKRVIQGQEPERVGDDPNEWMSHCRTIHPKMYAKAMVAALNESASPAPTSPPTSAVPPTSAMPPSLVQSAPPATSSPPTPPLSSDPPVILQSTESIPTVPPPAPATQIPATFNQPDTIPLKNGRDSMGG